MEATSLLHDHEHCHGNDFSPHVNRQTFEDHEKKGNHLERRLMHALYVHAPRAASIIPLTSLASLATPMVYYSTSVWVHSCRNYDN